MDPDIVTLPDLARSLGINRRRLHRQLTALDRKMGGLVLLNGGRRGATILVNRSALEYFKASQAEDERLVALEAKIDEATRRVRTLLAARRA